MAAVLGLETSAVLGIAAAIALAGWLAVLAVVAVATRPRRPDRAAPTMDLGPETPAVASFLVHGYRVEPEAAAATLIDLAARGHLDIDQISPERVICRVASTPRRENLAAYEDQVLGHLRSVAVGGVVPTEALTTGPEDQSSGWWRRFRKSVQAEARALGLARPRWPKALLSALFVLALVPAGLAAAAFVNLPNPEEDEDAGDDVAAGIGLTLIGAFGLAALPKTFSQDRDTAAGRRAASHWTGVQQYLDDHGGLDDHSPAGVAVWDRYLAYGAALDACAAVAALPFGAESPRRAWSAEGGRWRHVRVRYPRRIPPGWGRSPVWVALVGAALCFGFFLFGTRVLPEVYDIARDALDELRADDGGWNGAGSTPIIVGIGVVAALVGAFLLAVAVAAVTMVVNGLADLGSSRVVQGTVVRRRLAPRRNDNAPERAWIAVDDASTDRVRAFLVPNATHAPQGQRVRVVVTRRLGHLRECALIGPWEPPRP